MKPRVCIVRVHPNKIVDPDINVYMEILNFNGYKYDLIGIDHPFFFEKLLKSKFIVFKWTDSDDHKQIANSLFPVIRLKKDLRIFPNYDTSWTYDDKVKQYFMLKSFDFPVVNSWVYWDYDTFKNDIVNLKFPIVFKLRGGAGAINVKLIKNETDLIRLAKRMFNRGISSGGLGFNNLLKVYNDNLWSASKVYLRKFRNYLHGKDISIYYQRHKNYLYLQEFLPGNNFDIRVTTAGLRVHAFRRFNRNNDFRASGSNNWDIDPSKIDLRIIQVALEVTKKFNFQAMAYDFIYDKNGDPKIVEMSYRYGGAGYPDFMNGYWDENLQWHEGRYWPQYFELIDLLNDPYLKLPNLGIKTSYDKVKI